MDEPTEGILIQWDEIMKHRKRCIETNKNDPVMRTVRKQYEFAFQGLMDTRTVASNDKSRQAFLNAERTLDKKCKERQLELGTFIQIGNN